MSLSSKVIWSEGMFLNPHHFQQYDRTWSGTSMPSARPRAPMPGVYSRWSWTSNC